MSMAMIPNLQCFIKILFFKYTRKVFTLQTFISGRTTCIGAIITTSYFHVLRYDQETTLHGKCETRKCLHISHINFPPIDRKIKENFRHFFSQILYNFSNLEENYK